MKNLNHTVFWPPLLLLVFALAISLLDPTQFQDTISGINNWILFQFDDVFAWATLAFLMLVLATYFTPLGKHKIGGNSAETLLSKWQLFSITLCTTIATGILFWGCAEPLFHKHLPPSGLNDSTSSVRFAMGALYMHWSFTPYAIYCMIGLVFAISYYRKEQAFSIGVVLEPILGNRFLKVPSQIANIICLFALVAGMAASLGAGILTISGGLNSLFETEQGWITNGLIALLIVTVFVASATSGLLKGIKWLSLINTFAFIALAVFIFSLGPVSNMLEISWNGFKEYISSFISRSTINGGLDLHWTHQWTIFNWANWLAWAPITAMFLGKIARGYTVRNFIEFNFLLPALFGIIWMSIFGGAVLHFDEVKDGFFYATMTENGPQSVVYSLLKEYPFAEIISVFFLLIVFISFVTAADSNTTALSGISSNDTTQTDRGHLWIKLTWGIIIGAISYIMITYSGIDGIRILSVIGGFPVLFLMMLVALSLIRMILNSMKNSNS